MGRRISKATDAPVQATIFKKCDRTYHKPATNKRCAAGTCQHTCEPAQVGTCAHKWTVRYSAHSKQHEASFTALEKAQNFQRRLTADKKEQGDLFTDPKAGKARFLPLCAAHIGAMAVRPQSRKGYRSNFANPAVTKLLENVTVTQAAQMRDEVTKLLNVTLGAYGRVYRENVRRVITGTLDDQVVKGAIPRHALTGIRLGPRTLTGEQAEAEAARRELVTVDDETVRMLADGMTYVSTDKIGRRRTRVLAGLGIAVWLQRTMGLRIREALGVRRSDFRQRPDGTRYLHLCWQASMDGRTLEPLKHREEGQFRDVPVPDMVWAMVAAMDDGPLCPGPKATPYMPYVTAHGRFNAILAHLGVVGVRTHSLRHQFANEALDASPRDLANISQVLGHDKVETTLRYYIHAGKDAEQRISAIMNTRWTTGPGHGSHGSQERHRNSRPRGRAAAPAMPAAA